MSDRIQLHHGQRYRFQLRHQIAVLTGTFWYDEMGMRFEVPNGEFNGLKEYAVFHPRQCVAIWEIDESPVTVPVS